jgi:hypothetical protein
MYSNTKKIVFLLGIILGLFNSTLHALDELERYYHLNSSQIIAFFAGKTLHSLNVRTRDKVLTYLSTDGTIKQSIKSSDIQRRGKWHAANNQLCLKWQQSDDEYCFDKVLFRNDLFYLVKDNQVETIVHTGDEGDTTGF